MSGHIYIYILLPKPKRYNTPEIHKTLRTDDSHVYGDHLVSDLSEVLIIQELDSTYKLYVVRIPWQSLGRNKALTIVFDPSHSRQFETLS